MQSASEPADCETRVALAALHAERRLKEPGLTALGAQLVEMDALPSGTARALVGEHRLESTRVGPPPPPPPPPLPLHEGYCAALQSLADRAHAVPVQLAGPCTHAAPEAAVPPQCV